MHTISKYIATKKHLHFSYTHTTVFLHIAIEKMAEKILQKRLKT